jgi:hypothetical protein
MDNWDRARLDHGRQRLVLVFGGSQAVTPVQRGVARPALVERYTVLHVTGDDGTPRLAARETLLERASATVPSRSWPRR